MVQWIGDKWTGEPPQCDGPKCPECERTHVGVDGYCLSCYPPHKKYQPPKAKKKRGSALKPGATRVNPTEKDKLYLESMGIKWD